MNDRAENILIVDDMPDNLRLLSAMLSEQGYRVRKALNGKTALQTVRKVPPDLILLDINMPDMNGYEVCIQLKADASTEAIPVIFISALDDVLDKVKAFEVGGVDYITKPFQGQEVLARVKNQLTICRQRQQLQTRNTHLAQEIEQREKAEEALMVYLHAVSHDLRNPVVGLSMLLKSILRQISTQKNDQAATLPVPIKHLVLMEESCDRQLNLINSLVETQQFETEGVRLNCAPLSLGELTTKLAAEWEARLSQEQTTLINQIPEDFPLVYGDADQLWRVFENLMANAIKHNSLPISITISADIEVPPGIIRCCLQDNGVGMPPEQAEQLFERYHRGQNARHTLGLGLGLYLCRQIIEAHGGQIGALAQPDGGATFWFTLPSADSVAEPSSVTQPTH